MLRRIAGERAQMDLVDSIRDVTGNLDRALSDFRAGDSVPLVRAIAGCETPCQAGMLAAAICTHLARAEIETLLDALSRKAMRVLDQTAHG